MKELDIRLHISPGAFRLVLSALLLGLTAGELGSENVTLTTYYPAPSGIYTKMITTGDTALARDSGSITVGADQTAGASGLRVNGPINAAGVIQLGGSSSDPPSGQNGMLYYNTTTKTIRGYQKGSWTDIASGGGAPQWVPSPGYYNPATPGASISNGPTPDSICQAAGFRAATSNCQPRGVTGVQGVLVEESQAHYPNAWDCLAPATFGGGGVTTYVPSAVQCLP